ncbi:MAG: hypothetical protein Q9172_000230 [Xanthocarpia lactea]
MESILGMGVRSSITLRSSLSGADTSAWQVPALRPRTPRRSRLRSILEDDEIPIFVDKEEEFHHKLEDMAAQPCAALRLANEYHDGRAARLAQCTGGSTDVTSRELGKIAYNEWLGALHRMSYIWRRQERRVEEEEREEARRVERMRIAASGAKQRRPKPERKVLGDITDTVKYMSENLADGDDNALDARRAEVIPASVEYVNKENVWPWRHNLARLFDDGSLRPMTHAETLADAGVLNPEPSDVILEDWAGSWQLGIVTIRGMDGMDFGEGGWEGDEVDGGEVDGDEMEEGELEEGTVEEDHMSRRHERPLEWEDLFGRDDDGVKYWRWIVTME